MVVHPVWLLMVVGLCPRAYALEPSKDSTVAIDNVEQIVVTGSRNEQRLADAPVAVEVIGRPEIEISGAENLADLLEEHPSIDVFQTIGGTAIRLQGLSEAYTLILVNGQRTTGRIDGTMNLTRFAAEDIERVEIVRGPSSALYGSEAIGGVINIITRRTENAYEALARTTLGIIDTDDFGSATTTDIHASGGVNAEVWSTRVTAGYHTSDGYDLEPDSLATTSAAFETFNVSIQGDWVLPEEATLFGNAEYRFSDQRGVAVTNGGRAVIDSLNRTETVLASLGTRLKTSETSKLVITGNYTQFKDQSVSDQRNASALDTREVTADEVFQLTTQFNLRDWGRHSLTLGFEGLHEVLDSDRIGSQREDRQRGALYLQDEWLLLGTRKLVLVPGFRIDYDSKFGVNPTPKLSVRIDPHRTLILRASYGWGFRAPSFKELYLEFENPGAGYVVRGNPELQPEISRSVNLHIEHRPYTWFSLSVNFFRNDIENLIGFINTSDGGSDTNTFLYFNTSSAYTQGIEAACTVQPLRALRFDVGYTLTDTNDNNTGTELPNRARHRGTLSTRFMLRKLGLEGTIRSSIVGSRIAFVAPDDDTDILVGDEQNSLVEVAAAPYATVDARLSETFRMWGRSLSVFLGVENILNAGEVSFNPLQPRTFSAGVRGEL